MALFPRWLRFCPLSPSSFVPPLSAVDSAERFAARMRALRKAMGQSASASGHLIAAECSDALLSSWLDGLVALKDRALSVDVLAAVEEGGEAGAHVKAQVKEMLAGQLDELDTFVEAKLLKSKAKTESARQAGRDSAKRAWMKRIQKRIDDVAQKARDLRGGIPLTLVRIGDDWRRGMAPEGWPGVEEVVWAKWQGRWFLGLVGTAQDYDRWSGGQQCPRDSVYLQSFDSDVPNHAYLWFTARRSDVVPFQVGLRRKDVWGPQGKQSQIGLSQRTLADVKQYMGEDSLPSIMRLQFNDGWFSDSKGGDTTGKGDERRADFAGEVVGTAGLEVSPGLVVESLGEIEFWDARFHDAKNIWPKGYRSRTRLAPKGSEAIWMR